MSDFTFQVLSDNVKLLKTSASKYAVYGVLIAVAAIIIATCLVSYYEQGRVTLDGIIQAQKTNVALWLLNLAPFGFAVWGQYVSSIMAFKAGAMIVDQTTELRAQVVASERKAKHEITHDRLTNLPNRVLMEDRLEQAIHVAQRERRPMAVLTLDVDQFKEINDTLGRDHGDRLLRQVAARLTATVKDTETISRSGGDEFTIILPSITNESDAIETSANIGNALKAAFDIFDSTLDVRASIGIALYPEHGMSADDLLQHAEVAMYVAKKEKCGYALYDPRQEDKSPRRVTLAGELRQALERNQLFLKYQPKLNVRQKKFSEVEVLARWQHPRHGVIEPDEFIPLAERTGLIKLLTSWVLKNGIRQVAEWARQDINLDISVNISAQDLHDDDLYDRITGLLAANQLRAEQLVLEVTESTIMVDKERAMSMLNRLAATGIKISVDDFGTGYSSLAHLSALPISEVKIDKSFVMDMLENSTHAKIVRAIIDLGHNLGMKVVAEGVDDPSIYRRLAGLGCDGLQGHYLGKPLYADEIPGWLSTGLQKVV
jgi:diguanylate cyclase (GGDEF)-like protein